MEGAVTGANAGYKFSILALASAYDNVEGTLTTKASVVALASMGGANYKGLSSALHLT